MCRMLPLALHLSFVFFSIYLECCFETLFSITRFMIAPQSLHEAIVTRFDGIRGNVVDTSFYHIEDLTFIFEAIHLLPMEYDVENNRCVGYKYVKE